MQSANEPVPSDFLHADKLPRKGETRILLLDIYGQALAGARSFLFARGLIVLHLFRVRVTSPQDYKNTIITC